MLLMCGVLKGGTPISSAASAMACSMMDLTSSEAGSRAWVRTMRVSCDKAWLRTTT